VHAAEGQRPACARRLREEAFLSYDSDLRARLGFSRAAQGDAATPRQPVGPPRCVASERPAWREASAEEKKRMLAECRAAE
jgi:hypothetical protein